MYQVDLYARVRRAVVVEGMSHRQAARVFDLSRKTIRKMLAYSEPPGYRRKEPARRPKLGSFVGVIDEWLERDKTAPAKQRHTAKRIWGRLREEHGFTGGYTAVKDYVRGHRERHREMFVPLVHPPGHAQADFGEATAVIGGVARKIFLFVFDLPHSDAVFVKAYPAEKVEAWLDGHNAAFAFFGGVPRSILYDNSKRLVAQIEEDGHRRPTKEFAGLLSHALFEDRYGRPGKGNDKGKVEGLVGFARRNWLVPIPDVESFDELNAQLEARCRERQSAKLRGHSETIGERLERDRAAFLALPATAYDACEKWATRVRSTSLVRYHLNDYSVPVRYGHREVLVRGYVDEVVISSGAEEIARHRRSYEKDDFVFNPLHYLELIEQKVGALDQAAPLVGWQLPERFEELRRRLEGRLGKPGKREYVQVLRLLETFRMGDVTTAVAEALDLGAVSFDAVKSLLLCRIEDRPPKLNLEVYPHLPHATVTTTSAGAYMELLSGGVR